MMQLVKKGYHRSPLSRKQNQGGNVEQMRKINGFLTNISEKILKILCLRNTKSNQNFISGVLGYTVMFIVLLIYKFVL